MNYDDIQDFVTPVYDVSKGPVTIPIAGDASVTRLRVLSHHGATWIRLYCGGYPRFTGDVEALSGAGWLQLRHANIDIARSSPAAFHVESDGFVRVAFAGARRM